MINQRKIINSKWAIYYDEKGCFSSYERWTNEGWIYAPPEIVPDSIKKIK